MEMYTATDGESWDSIAYKLYKDEFKSTDIIAENPRLSDIIIFKGGEKIKLPESVDDTTPQTLAPWRRE